MFGLKKENYLDVNYFAIQYKFVLLKQHFLNDIPIKSIVNNLKQKSLKDISYDTYDKRSMPYLHV